MTEEMPVDEVIEGEIVDAPERKVIIVGADDMSYFAKRYVAAILERRLEMPGIDILPHYAAPPGIYPDNHSMLFDRRIDIAVGGMGGSYKLTHDRIWYDDLIRESLKDRQHDWERGIPVVGQSADGPRGSSRKSEVHARTKRKQQRAARKRNRK